MSGREKPLILQNGMPIPQEYDKDLGDWTEYSNEHIKAIKAELALVKAELQTIKTNQLSGDQKVQLSGTIREVIKAYYDAPVSNNSTFGENRTFTTTAGAIPLDISGYKDVVILIHNIGENAQEVRSIIGSVDNSILLPPTIEPVAVASGAVICIKDEDVLKYSTEIRVSFWKSGNPETVMDIVFLGVRL